MNPRAPRRHKLLGLISFAAVAIAVFLYLYSLAGGRLGLENPYRVTAVLPDGFGLERDAEVRAAGVTVGRVAEVEPEGSRAAVVLELDEQALPVYENAQVRLRARTPLGENYVQISPGGPPADELRDGERLPVEQAEEAVQFDEILGSMDPETRRAVRTNLRGLGRAFADRSTDVNAIFDRLDATTEDAVTVLDAVHWQRRDLARMIDGTATVLSALSERQDALRGLVVDVRDTAEAASSRDQALRETVQELPGTLRAAREAIGGLERLSVDGRGTVADFREAVVALRPALVDLTPAARDTRALLERMPRLTRELNPLLTDLRQFSDRSQPAVRDLLPVIEQLEPAVSYMTPYAPEVSSVISNMGSFLEGRDATGYISRVQLLFDETTPAFLPPETAQALAALREVGLLQEISPGTDANPYPKPGTLDRPQPYQGPYPKVAGPPEGGR